MSENIRLYPLTIRHICERCGEELGKKTYATGIAHREWTEFYQNQHWQNGCDGAIKTLMPKEE